MQVLKILFICLEVVLLFNLLIVVHEIGHFQAARWRGIWFGKPIWKTKIDGVDFCLGSIPAGGYVALPQMAPMETIEGKNRNAADNLPPVSPLDKVIVAFAGPLFSFSLALAFAVLVWGVGRPVSEADATTVIGYVKKDSPAEKAGLRPGDRILKVDGHPVTRFSGIGDSIMWRVVSSEGEKIPIEIERDGKVLTVESRWVKEETKSWERKSLRQIQIAPVKTPLVGRVEPNSPAALAGIRPNDVILEVDGIPVLNPEALSDDIEQKGAGKELKLAILRDRRRLEIALKAEMPIFPPDFPAEEKRPAWPGNEPGNGRWTIRARSSKSTRASIR